jgi:hypothetical protein
MELWLFLGGFAAVAILTVVIVIMVRNWIRKIKRTAEYSLFSTIVGKIRSGELDMEVEESPRSLNGCDSLVIPQILRDFPDFDADQAKDLCSNYLRDQYRGKSSFTIYNVVFSQYLRSSVQKTIVMQASASYINGGKKKQIRCQVHYAYHVETADESIAANCPNCGGALGYGVTVCPFCDSRVANVMGNTWRFKNLQET